ncbi:uncharacterized protein LOC124263243 isoform X2 [Haliotis rubra]|uniref:uncharacterized protein LOC124263243 isoform X1 n=1 Tax=Haliotis rubra TaxID=36100 RepID=UPI001EE5C1B5|nr:uncharacterized protein LOC124263243 isoform X1 [Haliotis rubra]XP_046553790.1 uncharacterized protein LOC124263243 isoform X2 [Haliotis rubra]
MGSPIGQFGNPLSYAADNIGVHVKQSLKERVWNGEYVDLALLTDKHIDGEEEGFRMVTDSTVGTFSESSTSSRSNTNTSTTRHLADLDQEAQRLLQQSLSSNTWATYETVINTLHTFRAAHNLDQVWPVPIDHMVHFIAYMSLRQFSFVKTYISALSTYHKLKGIAH